MKKSSRIPFILLGIAVLTFLAYQSFGLLVRLGWLKSDCSDAVKQTVVSPDGKFKAVLMQRNCGFAAETYAHVDLLLPSEIPSIDRFSGRIQPNTVVASEESYEDFEIRWLSQRALMVKCNNCAGTIADSGPPLARSPSWNDVAISYESR
jgi:hypothetical protein